MSRISYGGSVPMRPEIEKGDFFFEDDLYNKVPEIYFEYRGDLDDPHSGFEFEDNSVIVVKGEHVIKYTEVNYYDVLVRNENGEPEWINGMVADICGVDEELIEDTHEVKEYRLEEYDLTKGEKRKFKIVLEETSEIDVFDRRSLDDVLGRENRKTGR